MKIQNTRSEDTGYKNKHPAAIIRIPKMIPFL